MYDYNFLISEKIKDSLSSSKYVKDLVADRYSDKTLISSISEDISFFIFDHKHAYQFNNFHNLMYESLLKLKDNRFANFIRNIVNNHPDKNRTYEHLFNDIIDKLDDNYKLPKEYLRMSQSELNNVCDDLLMNEDYFTLGKIRKFIKENFHVNDYSTYIRENRDIAIKVLKEFNKDETDDTYDRIKTMLYQDHRPGYLGLFTYFHFKEEISLMRLRILFRTLKNNRNILRLLPIVPVNYMNNPLPHRANGRTYTSNFERLEDDLTRLIEKHNAKKFSDEYPRKLGHDLENDESFVEIVKELTANTKKSKEKLDLYQKFFLKKVSRYKTQEELIKGLSSFIFASSSNDDVIKQVNSDPSGLKLLFNSGDMIIMRVLSQDSLEKIAGDTSWCIKDSLSYWKDYVGDYNTQLVIIDLSKPESSLHRKIGVTLYGGGTFNKEASYYTGHLKNDSYISESDVNKILEDQGLTLSDLYEIGKNFSNQSYSSDEIAEDERSRYGGW